MFSLRIVGKIFPAEFLCVLTDTQSPEEVLSPLPLNFVQWPRR